MRLPITRAGLRSLWSWDLWIALVAAVIGWVAGHNDAIRDEGLTLMLALAAGGAGFLATVLTALGLLVAQFDGPYRQILERADTGGIETALSPYKVVAGTSALAAGVGALGAVIWNGLSPGIAAVLLALTLGFVVWSVVGTMQLVTITIFHIKSRSSVDHALAQAAEIPRARATRPRSRAEHRND